MPILVMVHLGELMFSKAADYSSLNFALKPSANPPGAQEGLRRHNATPGLRQGINTLSIAALEGWICDVVRGIFIRTYAKLRSC
jgi:hypothetical protein